MESKLYVSPVRFDKKSHTYSLNGKPLQGVTSTLLRRAFPNKYKDVPEAVLRKAAERGSMIHEDIEYHDKFKTEADSDILSDYDMIKAEKGLRTLANEYLVSDEENYASSVDVVLQQNNGEISLADIKTTYKFDRQSVALQLSIYKIWFEASNPGLKVAHLYGIWIRDGKVEFIEVQPVGKQIVKDLIKADLSDKPFSYATVPQWFEHLGNRLKEQLRKKDEIENELEGLKADILEGMRNDGLEQIKTGSFTISYCKPTSSKRFDAKLLKEENKELYDKYCKTAVVKASIKIRTNKE